MQISPYKIMHIDHAIHKFINQQVQSNITWFPEVPVVGKIGMCNGDVWIFQGNLYST